MKTGWSQATLGDVCKIQSGAGFPLKHQGCPEGDFPFFKVGDMNTNGNEAYLIETPNYISEEVRSELGAKVLPPESIVFPKVGGAIATNKKRRIKVPSCVDNNVMGLVPEKERISSDFLAWWMHGIDIYEFSNKANPPSITQATVKDWPILIPPLEEQRQIVAVLDEAFEGLTRARAHAEVNLEDSHEIAIRSLDVLIADLIERNGRIPISEIAAVKGGKRLPKGEKTSPVKTPFPYVTVRDFTEDGTVSTEKLGFISEAIQIGIARYTISSQDVYVSIAGTIGKSGIVPDELDGANLTENAAKLVLEHGWSNEYVYWCTRSSDFGAQTAEQTRVAAQPKLALQRLGAITVPKADETEQVELCEKMASLRSTRSDLVVAYGQKLQDLEDLRQSLLQKALAGELT